MLSIHWKKVRFSDSGMIAMRPDFTASIGFCASVFASTYHCSVSHGSIATPDRSPNGTICVCGSIFSIRPRCSNAATTFSRAS